MPALLRICAAAAVLVPSGDAWLSPTWRTAVPPRRHGTTSLCMVASSTPALPDTSTPIPSNTFAGMVERALLERFDEDDIRRVLTSWRLLDKGYEHTEYVGEPGKEDSSNMVQECHSYVPGLRTTAFWDAGSFDWAGHLQKQYPVIKKEFEAVTRDMEKLKKEGNNVWAGALTEDATSYGLGWKTLVLMDRGRWDADNVNLFSKTAQAVRDSGVPATEVFFASMDGGSTIKQHTDFTNFVLTSHLPLYVPCNGQNKCRLSVGDETRQWLNGNLMVFDTSLLHDAVNESDETRYILMMRLWHPDLTPVEREALQFTYDCLEVPGLVSEDASERFMAENMAASMKAFPEIRRKAGNSGFGASSSGGGKKRKSKKVSRGKNGFGM